MSSFQEDKHKDDDLKEDIFADSICLKDNLLNIRKRFNYAVKKMGNKKFFKVRLQSRSCPILVDVVDSSRFGDLKVAMIDGLPVGYCEIKSGVTESKPKYLVVKYCTEGVGVFRRLVLKIFVRRIVKQSSSDYSVVATGYSMVFNENKRAKDEDIRFVGERENQGDAKTSIKYISDGELKGKDILAVQEIEKKIIRKR